MTKPSATTTTSRRDFLKTSTGVVAGASLLGTMAIPRTARAGGNEALRIGLIGAGLRGTAAAQNALSAHPQNVLVAVGDAFPDVAERSLARLQRLEAVKSQVQVTPDRVFTGFDAYKHVVDSGVDVVLLAEPPHFRPQHLAYAVEAGKHAFVEKPIAVDAPGVRSVVETCRLAEKKQLAIVSGLCWRYDPGVKETMRRVLEDRAIGDIVAIRSCYNTGTLWHRGDKSEWSRMEYQIRNWLYHTWLSGDHIAEQAIHSLDKVAWLQGDVAATRAFGTGGRQQRTEPEFGDIYDHHTVFYEFPTGVQVSFMCRQQGNCTGYVDEFVLGTKGAAQILENRITGENNWHYEGPKADMYDLEHVAMFDSIRNSRPINNGHYMCNSTMLAIMGRMCTYTGRALTWDECYNSDERLGPSEYAWNDDVPKPIVAIPGTSKSASPS
jgi:predicted dehydrogenase